MLRAVRKAAALKIVVYEGTYGGTYGGTNEYEGVLINKLPSYIRRYEGTKVPSFVRTKQGTFIRSKYTYMDF